MDAAAVLLIELEGLVEAVEEQTEQIRDACQRCGAREFRVAHTAEERDLLWKGRKNAFGAVGRVSPSYYVQDGVVPRTQIAPTLRLIAEVAARNTICSISNIFHAGDGNMHPIILFNSHVPGELERAKAAGEEILELLHLGRRLDHRRTRRRHGEERTDGRTLLRRFARLHREASKTLFDPKQRLNPGKVLPTGRGCLEIRQPPFTRRTAV